MILNNSGARRSAIGAVVMLALFTIGCGSSSNSTTTTSPTNVATVTITNGVYSPNPVTVRVGQTVNWHNSDSIPHTATDPGVFDIGSIFPFSAASDKGDGVTLNTVGTYTYHCTLHANETATIVVTQ